jgi:hypothetical protein
MNINWWDIILPYLSNSKQVLSCPSLKWPIPPYLMNQYLAEGANSDLGRLKTNSIDALLDAAKAALPAAKDLPAELAAGTAILAWPRREDLLAPALNHVLLEELGKFLAQQPHIGFVPANQERAQPVRPLALDVKCHAGQSMPGMGMQPGAASPTPTAAPGSSFSSRLQNIINRASATALYACEMGWGRIVCRQQPFSRPSAISCMPTTNPASKVPSNSSVKMSCRGRPCRIFTAAGNR